MRTALAGVLSLVVAFLVGRWYFDDAATVPARQTAGSVAERGGPAPASTAPASAALGVPRPPESQPAAAAASDDDRLEAMMTEHRDAMLLLREAVVYEYFQRGSGLATCGDPVTDRRVCWVRFRCELRGQLMKLRVERIDCGEGRATERGSDDGSEGGERGRDQADVLADCVRANLNVGPPIGVPVEAADDLGDYTGPLEVSLTYAPQG